MRLIATSCTYTPHQTIRSTVKSKELVMRCGWRWRRCRIHWQPFWLLLCLFLLWCCLLVCLSSARNQSYPWQSYGRKSLARIIHAIQAVSQLQFLIHHHRLQFSLSHLFWVCVGLVLLLPPLSLLLLLFSVCFSSQKRVIECVTIHCLSTLIAGSCEYFCFYLFFFLHWKQKTHTEHRTHIKTVVFHTKNRIQF